jgi:hypothetical protein
MHRSKCLAAISVTSHKPDERAWDTKLKKLGLAALTEDPNETKKQQLLLSYKGGQ